MLLGAGEERSLRYDDFAAYYRRVRARFEAAIRAAPAATEPYPVEHCALCEFREVCAARWTAEDHLVQVANVRRDQVTRLREAGLPTLAALARAAPDADVAGMAEHTFEALRDQAALQLERRTTGRLDWHAVAADAGCGFELLPRASAGDVMFDIEGDPFWEPARGLHFLFGLLAARRTPTGSTERCGRTTGSRSGVCSRRSSTSSTSGWRAIPACTCTTTAPTRRPRSRN